MTADEWLALSAVSSALALICFVVVLVGMTILNRELKRRGRTGP